MRAILTQTFPERLSVVSQLNIAEGAYWIEQDKSRRRVLSSASDCGKMRYVQIEVLCEGSKEIYYGNTPHGSFKSAKEFWSDFDCIAQVDSVDRFTIVCDGLEEGVKALSWARQFCPNRLSTLLEDMNHLKTMYGNLTSTCYYIAFEKPDYFPWVYPCEKDGDLDSYLIESPLILCASCLPTDDNRKQHKDQTTATFKKDDVVLFGRGNTVGIASIVKLQKNGWYIAKDVFTSKCIIVTEYQVDGANVIQGVK